MKLPQFDRSPGVRKFDRFGEFYNEVKEDTGWWGYNANPFILLETGEFFLNRSRFSPAWRRFYKSLNISIFGSGDGAWSSYLHSKSLRLLTPGGDEIKRSWLTQGKYQTLVIDHDTNHVVRLSWPSNHMAADVDKRIPVRLRSVASGYWAGAGEPPVGCRPIAISEADPLKRDEAEHIDAMVAACNAWNTLSDEAKPDPANQVLWSPTIRKSREDWTQVPNPHYVKPEKFEANELLNANYTDLTWGEKKRIAIHGVKPRRKTYEATHLIIT